MVRTLSILACLLTSGTLWAQSPVLLTPAEIRLAHEFSPLPNVPDDSSNAFADDEGAALLGQALFYDARLSGAGDVSCSTCHKPELGFGDGRAIARGVSDHTRHSMTLWNVAYNRWFFWDGRKDTLWSQALAPLEDPREHNSSRLEVVHLLARDVDYARAYQSTFGELPDLADSARFPDQGRPAPDTPDHPHAQAWARMTAADQSAVNRVYANVGKSIAAFERQLVSRRAPFDVFVEGLAEGDTAKLAAISPAAQRGFALFAGKGQCFFCHDGPNFSDGEFHSNRIPLGAEIDVGRAKGIHQLLADPFNLRSPFSDDGGRAGRTRLAMAPRQPHVPGDFKTPTLRNVARSAPYMHDGQMATLQEVLEFYSTLENAAAPDPTGEQLIAARHFTEDELADLLAFLQSLTDEAIPPRLLASPETLEPSGTGR